MSLIARARAKARALAPPARDAKCGAKRPSDTFEVDGNNLSIPAARAAGPRWFIGSSEIAGARVDGTRGARSSPPVPESCSTPHGAARDAFEGSLPARRDATMATTMVTIAARAPARATARSAPRRSTLLAPVVRYPANVPRRHLERARSVFPANPSPRGVDRACSRVATRATDGDGDDAGASETPGSPDPADDDASPTSVEQAKQPKPGERAPQYRGVDITGGKYGYGAQIDDALDATTNPDQFLFGFVFLCGLAVFAFLFGPRPPSDYYG